MKHKYYIDCFNYNGEFKCVDCLQISKQDFIRNNNILMKQYKEAQAINDNDYSIYYKKEKTDTATVTYIQHTFDFNMCRTTLVECHAKANYRFKTKRKSSYKSEV